MSGDDREDGNGDGALQFNRLMWMMTMMMVVMMVMVTMVPSPAQPSSPSPSQPSPAQPSPVNGMQLGFRVTDSYMDSPAQRPPKWNARFSGRGKRLWSLETHAASKTRLLFACQEPPPEFFSQEPLGRAGGNASHQSSDEINVHTPAHIEMIFDFLDDLSTIFRRWLRTNYDPSISHC